MEYPGNGVVRFNAAIRVTIKRYNHAVTWATRHFISLISISKKYESNFKEISKLNLLVVIYECTSGQRKHNHRLNISFQNFWKMVIKVTWVDNYGKVTYFYFKIMEYPAMVIPLFKNGNMSFL